VQDKKGAALSAQVGWADKKMSILRDLIDNVEFGLLCIFFEVFVCSGCGMGLKMKQTPAVYATF
jgi:hypothetical protein